MITLRTSRAALALAAALAVGTPALAQQGAQQASFDRTAIPPAGETPELRVPSWTKQPLRDGAQLIVSERHTLPLVSLTITFLGGANQFEPAAKHGVASFAASMLSEGTKTRTGDQLSADLQLLGTNISVAVGAESGSIGFLSTSEKLEPTLAILADMLLNPTFPADALERLRARTLVNLKQARDRTGVIASNVFLRTLYGDDHPYGRVVTEQSVQAITREDVVGFYQSYFQPGRAIITVVGDVDPAKVKTTIERALAAWPAGGSIPSFDYPAPPTPRATTIYLVDKPQAQQSSFSLGIVGPSRDTPDYYAIEVMNTLLGGMFQSRLNANIREQKGYSYGVGSIFNFGKGPGAFRALGDIVTAKTDSALIEFMKELRGIRGERPISDEEIATAKANLVQGLPASFSSVSSVRGSITSLYVQGLPEDYYQRYARAIEAVSKEDLVRVATRYIDLDHLSLVIVGDRATIEGPLKATGIAPVVVLDIDGNREKPAVTP